MQRAVSIHIGVNVPGGSWGERPLQHSERVAWRMAAVANQAGYDSILVLRAGEATGDAVHEALTRAAGSLAGGDILFISFSGHGPQIRDTNQDDGCDRWDEGWCLTDGPMVDDQLLGYWRLFAPGVRILVVSESCFSGGVARTGVELVPAPMGTEPPPVYRDGGGFLGGSGAREPIVHRGAPGAGTRPVYRSASAAEAGAGPCIATAPRDPDGIRASVLMLTASAEHQPAQERLFSEHLLDVWDDGRFPGNYCDLYRQVRAKVLSRNIRQEPQIFMLGAPDLGFPLERAFFLDRDVVYRGVHGPCGSAEGHGHAS